MGYNVTNVLVVLTFLCCYVNADQCTDRGGQCKSTSSGWFWSRKPTCSNGRFISNLCSGPSNIKCCVPSTSIRTPTSSSDKCTARGGQCKSTSNGWFWSRKSTCSNGRFISNLCQGKSNIKCCVPNAPAVTATPTNGKCTAQGGQCKGTYSGCSNGRFISNLCSGPSNFKCCVPSTSIRTPISSGSYQCYGNFMKLNPAGAGFNTSSQDGLRYTGVRASNKMLDEDLAELNKRKQCYITAGRNSCIHPAVIAAVASRESRGGRLLYKTNGLGDKGKAWGIMQCDFKNSGQDCKKYPWDSCDHINQMTQAILLKYIKAIQRKHPSWASEYHIKGGVAAYNFGPGNVRSIPGMDVGTTGYDYSNDVIARAQHLVNAYGW